MYFEELKQAIESAFTDTHVERDGDSCSFTLLICSDELAAQSPVKRQQAIYREINPWIADGRVHAVSMKFFNKAAWAARA